MVHAMNAGVELVRAYLQINGYFTVTELPVIRETRSGYEEMTDLDVLGVRMPWAALAIPGGRPGPEDDLHLHVDTSLVSDRSRIDVIIGEVKEGKPRVNDRMRSRDALLTALRRVGLLPESRLGSVVDELQHRGVAVRTKDVFAPFRIRILAFGHGEGGGRQGYTVVPLRHVAGFVENFLDRYHDVLKPSDLPGAMGILHLLRKLR